MVTLFVSLIVISVLVLVHEFGHFWTAKRAGMRVEEFGIGFPPRLWSHKRGDTVYSVNAIPFGGFVRITGEDGTHADTLGSFERASFGKKLAVIVAGVTMNFLFACALLIFVSFFGLRVGIFDASTAERAHDQKLQVLQIAPESPAERGGLQALDEIRGFLAGEVLTTTRTPEEVQAYAFAHVGQDVVMVVVHEGTQKNIPLHLRQPTGPTEGPIGISLALTGVIRYSWYASIWHGIASAGMLFVAILAGYWHIFATLFTDGNLASDVSGPIGIAALTGQAARIGFNYLLQFVAMISVNLVVLNLLPFPALDGGRAVIILAEKLRGKAFSRRIQTAVNAMGFALLILLLVAVSVRDVVKFF